MIDWLRRSKEEPSVTVGDRVLPLAIRRHPRATRLTMRLAPDGSEVVARVVASQVVDPRAIPSLLLEAVATKPGLIGRTTYLQRINTRGGLAPSGACAAGARAEVPYTADYRFFRAA